MANVYTPTQLKITPPAGGFQQGAWYNSRQYWGGTLSEVNQIHPSSNQQGAGQQVSQEVVAQSAAAQGKTPEQMNAYLEQQRQAGAKVTPTATAPASTGFSQAGTTGSAGATAGLGTMPTQATLNLPDLYKSLTASSGISDIEKQYSDMEKTYIEAKGKVNDNPFLSEATRVGRIAKLESLFNERTANLKNDIATKKADIETQIALQTKQFDINSQATQQAWNQFNTLLQMGALSGASGEDIANITRSTGISSSMIQSAIQASQKKDVKTSVIQSTNDAGVVTVSVVNTETGEVINQQSLGAIGNAEKGTAPKALTTNEQKSAVESIINSYIYNEMQQAQISPEDLYRELLIKYPESFDYMRENWTPDDIRAADKTNKK
jgi:hypothetical protein